MNEQQRRAEILARCQQAALEAPNRADLQIELAHALQQTGDLHGAVQGYKRALQIDPVSYAAYNNLGTLFGSLADQKTALIFLEAAATLNPQVAEIHNNIANIYLETGQMEAAIESYRRAIVLEPKSSSYHNHLGNALRLTGDLSAAEQSIRRALELRTDYAEAYVNLGFVLFERGVWDDVEAFYRGAIDIQPDLALAHVNLSQMLLRRGELPEGWKEQEWRWQWKRFPSPKRLFTQPQWLGEEVDGARVLLHAEQGFGDTIQMLRYVPMVAQRGATIILEVHPELKPLIGNLDGVEQLIARGEPVPEFHLHCPLMSLPLAFSTTLQTIPGETPYLRADRETPRWVQKRKPGCLQVGVVWAGSSKNLVDSRRSLSLSALGPLFDLEGVSLYALQQGATSGPAETCRFSFAGCLPELADFAETAAAVSHLDLVVTVDTSVAHLAGALGKPVWILLPSLSDWRWLVGRDDSPWYPSARLFRQEIPGDWSSVIERVRTELERAVARKAMLTAGEPTMSGMTSEKEARPDIRAGLAHQSAPE